MNLYNLLCKVFGHEYYHWEESPYFKGKQMKTCRRCWKKKFKNL